MVQIHSSPPDQVTHSEIDQVSSPNVGTLGRFCAYFARVPRDRKSLGRSSTTTTTMVFIAITALSRGAIVAWEKESPRDFGRSKRTIQTSQRLSTVGGSDSITSAIRPARPSKGHAIWQGWPCQQPSTPVNTAQTQGNWFSRIPFGFFAVSQQQKAAILLVGGKLFSRLRPASCLKTRYDLFGNGLLP
jgi:hypothetical protein